MTRKPLAILSATLFGGLVGLILVLLAGHGLGDSAARVVVGWTLPLFLAAIAGGASWLMVSHDDLTDSEKLVGTARCGTCGNSVIADWRLCPYCGTRVDELEVAASVFDGDVVTR